MRTIILFFLLYASTSVLAQTPTHIPTDREPVAFLESTENIVLYIVLPLLIAGLYFLWRHGQRKEQNKK
jgi:heme/copper-type cytochrome/quinol oxidase subunit 2